MHSSQFACPGPTMTYVRPHECIQQSLSHPSLQQQLEACFGQAWVERRRRRWGNSFHQSIRRSCESLKNSEAPERGSGGLKTDPLHHCIAGNWEPKRRASDEACARRNHDDHDDGGGKINSSGLLFVAIFMSQSQSTHPAAPPWEVCLALSNVPTDMAGLPSAQLS
jgi:hypothetical protein